MARGKKEKGEHYVDNKVFLQAMTEWKNRCKVAEKENKDRPQVTNYIGECFLKIATHLSYRPNFINYTYRDEMIADGIENCLQYCGNFDPEKSSNPFAYFTQIIYYAFIRRIQKEKKQLYIKFKSMQNYEISPEFVNFMEYDEDFKGSSDYKNSDFRVMVDEFVDNFEKSKKKKAVKKKSEPTNLELFMGVPA